MPRGEHPARSSTDAITQAQASGGLASVAAILGLLAAFWSASGYIAAFMRASNTIYDVPEGRPIWKTLPIRLGVTAVIGVMLLASAVIVVFTGGFAEQVGERDRAGLDGRDGVEHRQVAGAAASWSA